MAEFSHLNAGGEANMVDVTEKAVTIREATAEGYLYASAEVIEKISSHNIAKGDVFAVARIAGIQGAKRCAELIPLCHPLPLSKVDVTFSIEADKARIQVRCFCKLSGKTGVEMEALTGVNIALLTLFDMCKAVDPGMRLEGIRVLDKKGGKTGHWQTDV
ncbi:cyclic pyranopterin monophosphate synthase MoaC [Alteromonas pelagimontana]|uniref:Cyclic pyranopterin monophosphate synthase n=1 Tax=Alteromonas pelagimontana TaxID=1858656 RepID=A0A6M4MIB1_9ALTE|nr:cyclic pyranopterin monophosphate synthase MoaC [Alteromonas pelagimontana]QJR82340.1 cyclic pyranopterin monophosphate synthase MoaC [Alteromonas pelagimontana]